MYKVNPEKYNFIPETEVKMKHILKKMGLLKLLAWRSKGKKKNEKNQIYLLFFDYSFFHA